MKYVSTRGAGRRAAAFCAILLEGLAPDGGLYLPERYPQHRRRRRWRVARPARYPELAFEILSLFIDDIPAADLGDRRKTYTREDRSAATRSRRSHARAGPAPPRLSNGPTLAFKDIAMQLLGNLFEYARAARIDAQHPRRDLGRHRQRGRVRDARQAGIRVFMLSPHGRMSPFQQAQMFSAAGPNIHNLAIEGVFDDCQDIVKACRTTLAFKQVRASARSTRSTGRASWRRSSTTSPAISRRRSERRAGRASRCRRATSATSAPATSRA
jgi:threonine synthase